MLMIDTLSASRRPALGFWSLTLAMMGIGLAMGTGLPALALGLSGRGWSTAEVGLGVALLALGQVLALPVALKALAGGRARRVLGMGLCGTAMGLSGLAMGLPAQAASGWGSGSMAGLMTMVLATGLALGVVFNVAETWVHELVPGDQRGRWVAVHCTLFTLAQLGGPLLLQAAGLGPALGIAAALVLGMMCGLAGLPAVMGGQATDEERQNQDQDGPQGERYAMDESAAAEPTSSALDPSGGPAMAQARALLRLALAAPATLWATALFALFDTVVLSLLPLYLQTHGFSTAVALTSASVVLLGDVVMEVPVGWWADRWGVRRVQALCAAFMGLCALAMPWLLPAGPTPAWWLLMGLLGGAAGGIYVLSVTACGQQFHGFALARMTALLGAAWGGASCVGPALAGQALGWGGAWSLPGLLVAGALLLLAGLWWEGLPRASALRASLRPSAPIAPTLIP
jgi:MFS family permease